MRCRIKFATVPLRLVVAVLLTVDASFLMGQTGATGALTGVVNDPSGAAIPGATVVATDNLTGQTRTTTTDTEGAYEFSILSPASYRVAFSKPGFNTVDVAAVNVNVTETTVLDCKLAVGAKLQQITVTADAPALQTQNATLGMLFDQRGVTKTENG